MSKQNFTMSGKLFCLSALFAAFSFGALQTTAQTAPRMTKQQMEQVVKKNENTISFLENKGQWQNDIIAIGRTNIGNMAVTKDHLHFISYKKKSAEEVEKEENEKEEERNTETHGWGISFDGFNPAFTTVNSNEQLTRYNYFTNPDPKKWASDVASYGEMTLQNIYQGVDLRLYSQKDKLIEFDWIVNPGVDYHNIKMRFKGQDGLSIDSKGNLQVKLRFDNVHFDIPEAYQVINDKKVPVKMTFRADGDLVTFSAQGKVDPNYALIIDPSLKWGTWFDNNSETFDEYLFAVDEDNSGNVYCGGVTNMSISAYTTTFGYDNSYNDAGTGGNGTNRDGIIYKIKYDGTALLYVTYFGGASQDAVYGLSLSPDKSVIYACGYTNSGGLPMAGTPFDNAISTTQDGWVAAFSAPTLNSLLYSSFIGGTGNSDRMVSIRGLSNNSFIVGGTVNAALSTTTPNYISNAYDATYSGGLEMYIAKFTSFNTLAFGTYVGGSSDDQLNDIQVFNDGDYVFTGETNSSAATFPALVNAVGTAGTGLDGIVGTIPAAGGNFSMLSRVGGTGADEFFGVAIGKFDTLFVTGFTASTDLPLGTGASAATRYDVTQNGSNDGLVGKLPRTGRPGAASDPWIATYFGGSGDDRGNTLRAYTSYALMIFGESQSTNFPTYNTTDGGALYDSTANGGWDIIWFNLSTDLRTLLFSTYVGGTQNDYLGETGTPQGSNQFVVEGRQSPYNLDGDSLIVVGTTVHSNSFNPTIIGPTTGGSAVFDPTANNTNANDKHIIFKWRIGSLLNFDYGDAPLSYGTPNHTIFQSIKLGSALDKEDFYPPVPGTKANYDDLNGATPDDEDGLPGNPTQVMIQDTATRFSQVVNLTNSTGQTATVFAWIDFNGNGVFDNSEVDTVRVASGTTSTTLRWTGFSFTSASDTSYMRIRISTDPFFNVATPSPTANATDGEVEDYLVIKYHCENLQQASVSHTNPTTCNSNNGTITLTNTNLLPNVTYTVYYRKNGGNLTGPFSITTQNNGTLVLTGLGAGSYTTIQIFHPTNPLCGDSINSLQVLVNPTLSVTNGSNSPVCSGGTISLTSSSSTGTSPFTYSWSGPSFLNTTQNPTISGVGVGNQGSYTVTITDATGCTGTSSTSVTVNSVLTATLNTNSPVCSGGTLTLSASLSGTAPFNYSWSGPASFAPGNVSSANRTNASSAYQGTYNVTVTDANGCSGTGTASVVVNSGVSVGISSNSTVCYGATLNLVATPSGGTPAFTYVWSGPSSFNPGNTGTPSRSNATGAFAGQYNVTVTDANGCTGSATASVSVNAQLTASAGNTQTICNGKTATLGGSPTASGGTPTYTYAWSGGASSVANPTVSPSGTTTYVVTVTDFIGCTVTASSTVNVNPTPTANAGVDKSIPICATVGITIGASPTASGGTSPYTYSWSPSTGLSSASAANPTVLGITTAQTYNVTVSDANGCSSTDQVVVSVTPNTLSSNITASGTTEWCAASGSSVNLTDNVSGGTTPYSYLWSGSNISPTNAATTTSNPNIAGTYNYSVVATDAFGCTVQSSTSVKVDPKPVADAGTTQTICNGNTATLGNTPTASGGTTPYTYAWTGGAAATSNPVVSPSSTTTYTVTVTDANGCSATDNATINVNPTPTANAGVDKSIPICATVSISIGASPTASGGTSPYTYSWSPSTGLSSTSTSNPSVLGITSQQIYTLVVTDNNGCSATDQVVVDVTANTLSSNITASGTTEWCATSGSSVNLTDNVTGGTTPYTYSWTGTNISPTNTAATTSNPNTAGTYNYNVIATDAFGCTVESSTAVTVDPIPTADAGSAQTVCSGTIITLGGTPTGNAGTSPYTYAWSGGLTTSSNPTTVVTATTTFTVTVTDSKGCTATSSASVTVNQNPVADAGADVSTPSCAIVGPVIGGSPTGSGGTGSLSYLWSPPSGLSSSTTANPNLSSLGSTTMFTVVVTDANGCKGTDSTLVTVVGSSLQVSISASGTQAWCENTSGQVSFTAIPSGGTAPYTYSWTGSDLSSVTNATTIANPNTAGNYLYSIVVTDVTGCQAGTSTNIQVYPHVTANAGSLAKSICFGTNLLLGGNPTASGGTAPFSYSWSGGLGTGSNPSITGNTNITYTLTVTDVNGCSSTASTAITVNPNPTANAGVNKNIPSCATSGPIIGGSPTGSGGTAPLTYLWSPSPDLSSDTAANPKIIAVGSSTVFTVTVTDANGCTASDNMVANVVGSTLQVVIVPNTSLFWCENAGGQVTLAAIPTGGEGPYSFHWVGTNMSVDSGTYTTVNPTNTGIYLYSVILTDATGCQAGNSIPVQIFPHVNANAGALQDSICYGQSVTLGGSPTATGGTVPYTYTWSGGATSVANPTVSPALNTTYTILVTDSNGCTATAVANVVVRSNPIVDAGSDKSLPTCSPSGVQIGGGPTASGGGGSYVYSWTPSTALSSSSSSNPTVIGLSSNTIYTVVATDNYGCSASDLVQVTVSGNSPSVSISSSGSSQWCAGSGTSVNLTANINGGVSPYTYNWSGTDINPTNTQVVAVNPSVTGSYTYTVTITDAYNCTSSATNTVVVNGVPTADAGGTNGVFTICSGTSVQIGGSPTATGGTAPYTYAWSNGAAPTAKPTVSPLTTTTYTVTVTDSKGCTATAVTTVIVKSTPVASAGSNVTLPSCSPTGVQIGGTPTATGGTAPYSYIWTPSTSLSSSTASNPTVQGLTTSTNYTVEVTDANGCTASSTVSVTVTNNPPIVNITAGGATEWCYGTVNGVNFTANITGGVPSFTYSWAGANFSPTNTQVVTASPTTVGIHTYTVTVTDGYNCTASATASIKINGLPTASADANGASTICSGASVTLGGSPTASGGTAGYTYSWSSGAAPVANPTVNPLNTTTYVVTVTDSKGCTATSSTTVNVNSNPHADAGTDQNITTCSADSVVIGGSPAASGGSGSYTYSWSPSTGLSNVSDANPVVKGILSSQTYTLTVTDNNGCSSTDIVVVNVVPSTLQANPGNSKEICSGPNSCVQLGGLPTAIGGTPPYVFTWSNTGTLTNATTANPLACPSSTTTYTVTITDSKGCSVTASQLVTVNPSPSADAGPDVAVCIGSTVVIGGSPSGSGGTGTLTYSWNPTTGLSVPNVANPSASPSIVTTYQLVVTDSKNCAAVDEAIVTPRSNPVVDAGSDKTITSCAFDSAFIGGIPVVVSGGTAPYTYLWSPSTGLNGTTFQNPVVNGISQTTSYQIVVTDNYGCTGTDFVIVNVVPSTLQADAGNDHAICSNAGTQVTIGGSPTAVGGTSPYQYSWSSSVGGFTSALANPVVSPTITTTYYVTVTDAKGCTSVDSTTVTVRSAPVADAGTATSVCSGVCVNIGGSPTATGGSGSYQYSWTPSVGLNANNISNPLACPSVTTTYNVLVTDNYGCTSSSTVTVTVNPIPSADAGVDKSVTSCPGDSVRIGGSPSASGGTAGYTYSWSPSTGLSSSAIANPYVSGISTTTSYTLTVTDANGCTAADAVIVDVVQSSLTAEAGTGGSICAGSTTGITIGGVPTVTGGSAPYVYSWSPSSSLNLANVANPVALPVATTKYYVTVTDSKGCTSVDSVVVTVNPKPIAFAGNDTAICAGSLVVVGGDRFNINSLPTGSGGTGPYTYSWSPGTGLSSTTASNPSATPNATTVYTVTVTDANGCSSSASVTITVRQNPVANAGPDKTLTACSADSVRLGGTPSASGGGGTYTYDWTPGGGLSSSIVSNPYASHLGSNSTYTLIVTDQYGCSGTDQVFVTVINSSLTAEAGNNVTFCQGASVNVTLGGNPTAVGGTPSYTYLWSPSNGLSSTTIANPVATPLQSTTYSVVVTDGTGCIATDTVRITIHPRPVVDAGTNDTICSGTCVTLGGSPTASGGTGSYTYNWTPPFYFSTLTTLSNPVVCATANITYVVTVTDSLGCTNTASVSVKVNENPVANAGLDKTITACPEACITIGGSPTATGGLAPYLYAWSPQTGLNNTGLANPTACNLSVAGTYTVTVTDAHGCTAKDDVAVTVNQSTLTADAGSDKSICANQSTGVVIGGTPAVSGGTGPYTINWSPSTGILTSSTIANPTVKPNDTTTYTLVVTDALGCQATDNVVVYTDRLVTASVGADTAICQGGSAYLGGTPTGGGGNGSFTYLWSPGSGLTSVSSANPVANPAATTTYCVTVTDGLGCTAAACQTVTVNPGVHADAGQDQTITYCPGSYAIIGGSPAATGGSGNYSYSWSPSGNLNGSTIPNPIVTGLANTTIFTLSVTDNATGCTSVDQVLVTVNQTSLTVDAGVNRVVCGSSTACTVIGGNPTAIGGVSPYLYQWAPVNGMDNPNIANPCVLPATTTWYYVTVTDQLGCNFTDSVKVTVSPALFVDAGNDTAICYATDVVLGATPEVIGGSGIYTFNWSPSQFLNNPTKPHPTAQNVTSNITYTVVVTDELGCTATDNITIAVRSLPVANAGPDATIYACAGDSAILGGSPTASGTVGPYQYSWNPPLFLSLSDTNAANPVIKNLGLTTQLCVTVTDSFGCKATDCTNVTVLPNTLFVNAGQNLPTLCSNVGGCITLGGNPVVTGGTQPYVYTWFGGVVNSSSSNPQVCPLTSTSYTLVVTDKHGCQASDTAHVIVNTPPVVNVTGLSPNICVNAGNVVMTGIPSGGTFSGPGVTGNVFQPAVVGTGYWCIKYAYTNAQTGCSNDTTICVTVSPQPVVSITGNASSYCQYEAPVSLSGTPSGGTFSGAGMSGTIFNPATANIGNNTITYTYTDPQTGCSNSTSVIINVKGAPTLSLSASIDTACAGSSVTITPTYSFDVFNIVWTKIGGGTIGGGVSPLTITPTGVDYCLVATAINTPNGCVTRDTLCLHVNQPPVVSEPAIANTCEDQSTTVDVSSLVTDPEGNTNSYTVVSTLHGTATVSAGGVITYNPTANYNGADTITYQVCNTNCTNSCAIGVVYVNICPVNDPPVITNITDTIIKNTTDTVCPVIFDVDNSVNALTVSIVPCGTINGQVSLLGNCVVYTPTFNWTGTQVICVSVCDSLGACDTGTVTIVVVPKNYPPIAVDDADTTNYVTPITISVLANDSDPDSNTLTVTAIPCSPAEGTAVINPDGTITYTPGPNANALSPDTFCYKVCDNGIPSLCDTAIVVVYIRNSVQAINDTAQITNLTPITINVKGNDFDPENDSFSVVTVISTDAIGSVTLNNDGTVQYVPSPDTCGFVDSFYYVIQDVHGAVDTGFVYVNVVCPIIVVAVNDSVSICKSDIINIPVLANDTVSSGLTLSVTGVSIPVPGNIGAITSIANNVVTFAANGNTGTVHFFYYACDNGEPTKCDTGEVTIVINACPPPVVDTIFDTTYVNTPDTICLGGLVQSTTSWAITSLCQPQNGTAETLSGDTCFVYTPNTGFFGNDTFCIVVCNQFGCDTSSVIITVLDTLIKAVAETCDVDTTVMNTPITLRVLANDIIPQAADTVVTIKSSPADGVAVVNNDKTITFTPNTNFKGEEQFSYQVCAVTGTRQYCDTAYICVTVVDTTLNCFIPNGFSPNGDGVNDNYEIPCNSKYPKAELRIFDRWGVEVWNSDGPYLNNWNGKNKQGIILPDGTYYVIYSYNDGSGKREAKFVVIHR